jgi:serine/threonine protein kinase
VVVELELEKVIGMGQFGVVLEVAAIYNFQSQSRAGGDYYRGSRRWCSHRNLLSHATETETAIPDDDDNDNDMVHPPNVKELLEKSQEIVQCSLARRQSILTEQQQQQQQETTRKKELLPSGTSSFDTITSSQEEEDYIHDLRNYMSLHYLHTSDGVPRYAVKQIRKDLYPKKKLEAAVELAREAKLLTCLNHHPHICQLKATVGMPGHVDFMMVLERLSNGTLYDKLVGTWKAAQGSVSSSGGGRFLKNLWLQHNNNNNNNSRRHHMPPVTHHTLLMDRLMALYDIAQAMTYLHSKM